MRPHPNRSVLLPTGQPRVPPRGPASPARSRGGSAWRFPRLAAVACLTSLACAGPPMPSADVCRAVREDASAPTPCQDTPPISRSQRSSLRCLDARLIQPAPAVEGGLCGGVLTRPEPTIPRSRFVYRAPHLRSTLPADAPSRERPGTSLVLRLHAHLDRRLALPSLTACKAHTPTVSGGP